MTSSCSTYSTSLTTLREQIASRYGDGKQFLETFNPDRQAVVSSNKDYVYKGESPKLINVAAAYGMHVAETWLEVQIQNLSEFAGCRDKLSVRQIEDTARVIIAEFAYLKVSEFMYFFHRFKSGRYGKFYGAVDSLVITNALQEFLRERNDELDRIRKEDEQIENERIRRESERESKRHWKALNVCNMTIQEWHKIYTEHHLSSDEIATMGWLFRLTPTKATTT